MVEPVPGDEVAENTPVLPEGQAGHEAGPADEAELSRAVVALTDDEVPAPERRRLLGRLVRLEVGQRGVKDLFRPKKAIGWITDSVTSVAPHIPVRDLD